MEKSRAEGQNRARPVAFDFMVLWRTVYVMRKAVSRLIAVLPMVTIRALGVGEFAASMELST